MNQLIFRKLACGSVGVLAGWLTVGPSGGSVLAQESSPGRPFVHPLFSDNMVVQRGERVPVWGWTVSGSEVVVTLAGQKATATAGEDGRWMVRLPRFQAGGPYELEVAGPEQVTLTNVLVGDVWLCSGQSNMEMGMGEVNNAAQEIARANYERMRLFTVPKHIATEPQALVASRWKLCTPETIVQGDYNGFSAAGYFFGRDLHLELGVPIGLIDSSWGGTVAEAWTSAEALDAMEDFRPALNRLQEVVELQRQGEVNWANVQAQWYAKVDPGSAGDGWSKAGLKTDGWQQTQLPQKWEAAEMPGFDGIVWYRRTVELPSERAGQRAVLRLGPVDDRDTTWVNGVRVGGQDLWNAPRDYDVPEGVLQAGVNVIAVRVLDTGGDGGFIGQADQMRLEFRAGGPAQTLDLGGPWWYRQSVPLAESGPPPSQSGSNPNEVTVLYNGMIAPLLPYPIKGAIWYQGESNADRALQYRELLPTLITDWRARFGVGTFPFLIVQLANFMAVDEEPVESAWAELREAQWLTARRLPKTELALAIDIGEANDIHPRNKQEVGRRLSLSARALAYRQQVAYSGPTYRSMRKEGNRIRLRFDHVTGGLAAKGGEPLTGFAVAGSEGRFVWAQAQIDGDTVLVSSVDVPEPVAVRYGWANNPRCNLYNQVGLPAVPFRTDSGD